MQTHGVSENAKPVCLPSWLENPYGPVSLWDIVIQFSAETIFWSGKALETLKTDCLMKPAPGAVPFEVAVLYEPVDDITKNKAAGCLERVQDECSRIGLIISAETIGDLREVVGSKERPVKYQLLMDGIDNIQQLIRRELKSKAFIHIPPEKAQFFPNQRAMHVLGNDVAEAFPSTNVDASEAGVCLALARPTASVFHLMRVLEIGLGVLGNVFGVSTEHTNWAPAIDQIESKIREMHKDPTWRSVSDYKSQQEFYSQAASHFGILKDAWRNYTAHARGFYTEERAELIFRNVRAFMQQLATRFHE